MSRDIDSGCLRFVCSKSPKNSVSTKQLAAKSQSYLRCLKLSLKNLITQNHYFLENGQGKK